MNEALRAGAELPASAEATLRERTCIQIPTRYALSGKIQGSAIRQLAEPVGEGALGVKRFGTTGKFEGRLVQRDGGEVLVVRHKPSAAVSFPNLLLVDEGDATLPNWPTGDEAKSARWLRPAPVASVAEDLATAERRCWAVRDSWRGQFSFREEVRDGDKLIDPGLRPPQIGALHAALAHWRVTQEPATIVMPTGTGKTETMLALFVRERLERLLVVVPTKPLRDQTVRKFETLGLLKKLGVVAEAAACPVVGTLEHKPRTPEEVDDIFGRCNVIVTTANIVGQCAPVIQARMAERCSHLFIDEAHHISAPTWDTFRRAFLVRPILQFTATPFRIDGKHVDGRVIFNYPLRKAQEEGYFKKVTFRPVYEFDRRLADAEIARVAIEQLEADLAAGFDHIVMARAADIFSAEKLFEMYADVAAEYRPVIVHSKLGEEERREALRKLLSGETRVAICVDMLGEGFDLPQLKIAALHDMHKSLAITLQFTGRFTRSHPGLGEATMVANIADELVEESLRALYAENADWNVLLRQLSEGATGRHVKRSDFLTRFTEVPAEVALQNVEPKMSAVFYRTRCANWRPERAKEALGEDRIYAGPSLNPVDHTVLFVTRDDEQVPWGNIRELSNTVWHLYLLHWNPEQQLLFINSSDHGSLHEGLAKAICGEDVQPIRGETVFRSLHRINRLVLMNLGLNHTISRDIRFSMHVGSDIGPAIAEAQAQNKKKSNLFGMGFENGAKTTIGCSQKGRVWSYRIAYDMSDWLEWCHHVGAKLIDDTISTEEPFRNLVVPQEVTARPELVPLAIEWTDELLGRREDAVEVEIAGEKVPFYEADLEIVTHTRDGPIRFRISAGERSAIYELRFGEGGVTYLPVGADTAEIIVGRRRASLTEWFRRDTPTVFFEDGSMLAYDHLLTPAGIAERAPFAPDRIEAWDWTGTDLRVESQTTAKLAHSIQRKVILSILAENPAWDIVFDDDGSNEAADVVAIRAAEDRIVVHLYHCKYSGSAAAGARVGDLYEVCGQAQRSVRWKRSIPDLIRHLQLRDGRRFRRTGISRFERGDASTLRELDKKARLLRAEMKVFIVQPGLMREQPTTGQLDLLAVTELYLKETYAIDFAVIASK